MNNKEEKVNDSLTLFLPYVGEFGYFILWYARAVHLYPATRKIVCCRYGEECLFPTAINFFYDWKYDLNDQDKNEVQLLSQNVQTTIIEKAQRQFGKIKVPDLLNLKDEPENEISWRAYKTQADARKLLLSTEIPIRIQESGINADLVITARYRNHHSFRNYLFWQAIVDYLKIRGYSVAIIGTECTSQELKNIDVFSWDHGGLEVCIELLKKAKFMITTDTGPAHLNVLCSGAPMLVIQHESWHGETEALTANKSIETQLLPRAAWYDTAIVKQYIDEYIRKYFLEPTTNR